ncbi:MAG: glucose-1-phosphate adenylyltransferase subunit GlgD [Acidaminobacteraceae bacterium]
MVNELMGIINLSESDDMLKELADHRPIAAVPFGGRYRIIDFQLSNMVNSGIEMVSVITKHKFRSLQDHVGSGKSWNLDRKRDGLFMLHPMVDYNEPIIRFGDIQTFKNNANFIKRSRQEYVILSKSYMVTNLDYKKAFEFHKDSGSDITMICKHISDAKSSPEYLGLDMLNCNSDDSVESIGRNFGKVDEFCLSLEMYIMKKDLLVDIIIDSYEKGDSDFLKEAVMKVIPNLNVNSYRHNGELFCMNSVQSYFKSSMKLLDRSVFNDIFKAHGKIHTKVKDEPSSLYKDTSCVTNSILANGSIIEGTVENSIIFRGVHIKKGSIVRNSIIMRGCVIGETANLNYVIADKNVIISDKKTLMGDENVPYVIKKNQII